MKQRFDFPRMISPESLGNPCPKIGIFLGFDARVPTDMAEYDVDPENRLYKGGQG